MITVQFEYHKPKVIQALRYHFISRKEIKVMMVLVNVFALLSAALFYLKKITPAAFMIGSLLWFMMMLVFWFFLPRIIYRKSSTFKDRFRLDISENELTLSNGTAGKSFDWGAFNHWMESPHFFHLYVTPTSFFLIPKDAFEGDDETRARSYFKKGISKQG